MVEQNEYAAIITGRNEFVKQFIVYDGSGRMTDIYEARANAEDGEFCMRTRYAYDGVSTRIEKRFETTATWDSAWDI